jgi:hypothetical protein
MLHAIQSYTMSPSSACSSSGPPHFDSLLQLENIEEHAKDTLSLHETTLPHLADILLQPENRTMTNTGRSKYRKVHIFSASDRTTAIGGLILTDKNDDTNCVTNANFYAMVKMIVIVIGDFSLRNESNITIEKDDSRLQPGNYYIYTPCKFFSSFTHN